jgi:hypothetical protein
LVIRGQHGFRPRYLREIQVIILCKTQRTLCTSIDAIITDFYKAFGLVPHDRLLTNLATSGVDSRLVVWVREFLVDRTQLVSLGVKGANTNSIVRQMERFGPTDVSNLRTSRLEEHRIEY